MAYNSHQKLLDNMAALEIALTYTTGTKLSQGQVEQLQRYSGFGGLKGILYPYGPKEDWKNASKADLALYEPFTELHSMLIKMLGVDLYKKAISGVHNSVLTAFYTPEFIPKTIFETLAAHGIYPKRMYEPSSGAGIFLTEAAKRFPGMEIINAVEKDYLTGRVLQALASSLPVACKVSIGGFEEMPVSDNGKYDLIASNIPFGNFRVFDPLLENSLTDKIHNYFFAKGLDKLGTGGIMAFITSDGFLNSPSNREAREYLFRHADLVTAAVLPDNLMKDTGNTESPSHLIIVQKHNHNLLNSPEEILETVERTNEFGSYHINKYLSEGSALVLGNEKKPGKNQYGAAHEVVWHRGSLDELAQPLKERLFHDFQGKVNGLSFQSVTLNASAALK